MKLRKLTLQNFGAFRGRHEIRLDTEGLVSIDGRNEVDVGQSNNGAGKSTILDGLLYGLYGQTGPRKDTTSSDSGLKADDVVNEDAEGECIVTVEWEHEGEFMRVERWRDAKNADEDRLKNNGVRLDHYADVQDGGWYPVFDLDHTPTQDEIEAQLGVDYGLALRLLVRSQEDPYNFAQSTPKERFAILTQIEGLAELDDIEARGREKVRDLLHTTARLEGRVATLEGTLRFLVEENSEEERIRWETKRQNSLCVLDDNVHRARVQQGELRNLLTGKPALLAKLQECDGKLTQLVTQPEPGEIAAWRQQLVTLNQQAATVMAHVEMHNATLQKLAKAEAVCPECGQNVDAAHLRSKVAEAEHARMQLLTRLEALDDLRNQASEVINAAQVEMDRYRKAIQAQRDAVTAERATANQQIYALADVENQIRRLDGEVQRLEREAEMRRSEENPYAKRAAEQAERKRQLEAELNDERGRLSRDKAQAGLVQWWVNAIPSMKAWIFDNVVDEITANANRWLKHFMGGTCFLEVKSTKTTKGGKVKDEIDLKLYRWRPERGWVERPLRRWSGGEKRRIAMAVDWALSDRLAQRSKFSCSFLALDEVDRNLDVEGKEGLLSALSELKGEKATVWIITQDPDFQAAPDLRWTVVKDTTGSHIEVQHGEVAQSQAA